MQQEHTEHRVYKETHKYILVNHPWVTIPNTLNKPFTRKPSDDDNQRAAGVSKLLPIAITGNWWWALNAPPTKGMWQIISFGLKCLHYAAGSWQVAAVDSRRRRRWFQRLSFNELSRIGTAPRRTWRCHTMWLSNGDEGEWHGDAHTTMPCTVPVNFNVDARVQSLNFDVLHDDSWRWPHVTSGSCIVLLKCFIFEKSTKHAQFSVATDEQFVNTNHAVA